MDTKELIQTQFNTLLRQGEELLGLAGWNGKETTRSSSELDYMRFRTSAINLVRRACGANSDHYAALKDLAENNHTSTTSYYFTHCLGILQAAASDFENGLLFDMKALIAADLLGDFVEQAEHLLANGYHVPAASLIGAVLEDVLRKLCEMHGIHVPEKTKLDRLNADLAKAEIYNKLTQKRITALADIRNNADHGHFDKFRKDDVEDMVKWVRGFAADKLQ
ncbi:HEPN domain-containing protein [Permianibacter aggregans]|uniref:HEPN domain-containing protein n=1 Tax=Permianibacter aggregans TaxID=1510150 RepID=A0A4R6UQY0_9GAMM|nr:HEPN domain-containing protein [Permianibacter aggregans]QGX39589.1 HEPN domain-containing protein [Permianibacter aggregans]TDQ49660.1 HEPN domain-containing protein [Permianibacter aggregans]